MKSCLIVFDQIRIIDSQDNDDDDGDGDGDVELHLHHNLITAAYLGGRGIVAPLCG